MKNTFSHDEQLLRKILGSDDPGIRPRQTVFERLHIHFLVIHPARRVQNSFAGFFSWVFTNRNMAFKASLASVMLAYLVLLGNFGSNSNDPLHQGQAKGNALVVDTNFLHKDTCSLNSLKN